MFITQEVRTWWKHHTWPLIILLRRWFSSSKAFIFARIHRFSFSRKVTILCVWCSLSRRVSRDLFAELLFFFLRSQSPSSLIARLDLSSDCTLLRLAWFGFLYPVVQKFQIFCWIVCNPTVNRWWFLCRRAWTSWFRGSSRYTWTRKKCLVCDRKLTAMLSMGISHPQIVLNVGGRVYITG